MLFFAFLALYTAYALMVLGLGITAAVAHVSPDLHSNLHLIGFDAQTLPQQIAQAVAVASHQTGSGAELVLDYWFRALIILLRLLLVYLPTHHPTAPPPALGI